MTHLDCAGLLKRLIQIYFQQDCASIIVIIIIIYKFLVRLYIYYSLNIGALHESDKTLKTEGLKSLNIISSSKKVSLQLLSELR